MSVRALSILAAALAACIGWQWSGTGALPAAPVLPVSDAPVIKPAAANAGDWARTALARPLMQPGRRPPASSPSTEPESAPPRLTALLSGPFGRRAIFALGGRSLTVEEGGDAGGWAVLSISAAGVFVRGRGGDRLLLLSGGAIPQPKVEPPPAETDEHAGGMPIRLPDSVVARQSPGQR